MMFGVHPDLRRYVSVAFYLSAAVGVTKPRNDMAAEIEQRVAQKMAEGDDDEHRAEDDKRIARAQSEKNERARDEFDERNRDARHPERPDRQEGVGERQKIFSGMLERAKLKNLHHAGHEKDQTEHQTCKENRPRAIQIRFHFFQARTPRLQAFAQPLGRRMVLPGGQPFCAG
jgi:hypothetical protein